MLEDRQFDRDDISFYRLMATHIHSVYRRLLTASQEVQKVINVYLRLAYPREDGCEEVVYSNLASNTLNYMIETDDTLKNLIRICDAKIPLTRSDLRTKLDELISAIETYYDSQEECFGDQLQSTAHSQEEESEDRKRPRKKKLKESDLSAQLEVLLKRLNSMVIRHQERVECRVSEQQCSKWQAALRAYRHT